MVESSSIITVKELEQFAIYSARHLGYEALKDKQLEAIVSFLHGNDTFLFFVLARSDAASWLSCSIIATWFQSCVIFYKLL